MTSLAGLVSRPPKTLVEMQIVVDRLVAELTSASIELVVVPLERTVSQTPARGVILTLSKVGTDLFGQVTEYEVPQVVHTLVHDGDQPFSMSAEQASSRAVSRLVERRRRLRVDVFVARTSQQWAELTKQWRVV